LRYSLNQRGLDMKGTDFCHIEFLSRTEWGRIHLRELLYSPDTVLWESLSADQFSAKFHMVTSRLGPDSETRRMLHLHLITEALLQKEGMPGWFIPWVRDHLDIHRYVAPMDWETCIEGRWRTAPVFFVHENAYLRYFILGLIGKPDGLSLWPDWADGLMDDGAKEGIECAVKACHVIHPFGAGAAAFLYPLTLPNQHVQITNASLGLPISLGFMALLNGSQLAGDLAASGTIRNDGTVGKVGRLSAKADHARKAGFRVFLFPSDNQPPSQEKDMDCLPVSDLAEAWTLAGLYGPGQAGRLLLVPHMLADPVIFISNCAGLPPHWLVWLHENGRTRRVMDAVSNSPDLFEAFVKKLDACLGKGDMALGRFLGACISLKAIKELARSAPVSAFKWFTLNLAMANHMGDVASAQIWENESETMVRQASMSDAEAFAAFCNHRLVGLYHNRYDFAPELPPIVRKVLDALESQYRSQQNIIENPVNEALGALYGTIAQNFGFCGPEYLAEMQKYADLSRRAFGEDHAPEMREHCLRQINYLTYAHLDAGDWVSAERTLFAYLEITDWPQLWSKLSGLSPWHHALLSRFFADGGSPEAGLQYAEWGLRHQDPILQQEHPWQLWCYNLGRLNCKNRKPGQASSFFLKSLDICLAGDLGSTVRVMGLLPLSGLWHIGQLNRVELDSIEKVIRKTAKALNEDHFRPFLSEPDVDRALENVWNRPREMFPFTYR
jgi:hypothetical protein